LLLQDHSDHDDDGEDDDSYNRPQNYKVADRSSSKLVSKFAPQWRTQQHSS